MSHIRKMSHIAALRAATPAAALTAVGGVIGRRFLSTNNTAVSTTGPSIVVADGAAAPAAEVAPAAETATLHVPVAARAEDDANVTVTRQLRRHITTTRTILRPLSASPWDILAADQDAQIATQRALLVRSYRGVQRRAVALHRLLRLHETAPLALPANTAEDEGMSLLRADAFNRHVAPLVLGVFTALVDPKALCCLLAPRAEIRFVNAIDAVIEAEHALLMHDTAVSAQEMTAAGSMRGARGNKRAAAAAAVAVAAAAPAPEVAAAERATLVAYVSAVTARLVHEVVRALYRWQELLSGGAGEVPTYGAARREEAARALEGVESEFKALVSARELVARRVSMRLTAPGAEVNVSRDERETEEAFEARSQRRDALVRAKVRHGTRRLIEAHEALQTSLEASKRLAVFHNAVVQTLDPAKIVPAGSPYQFSNTEIASGVAEAFRQSQLQVKRALNASSAPSFTATSAASADSAVGAASTAAPAPAAVGTTAADAAASDSAARLQVLLARAAQNKRDREARAAGIATATAEGAAPTVYSENGYDFWTLPAVQTKVSSVVEAAPLTLLSKAMRGADVSVAYWPTEVDREDDVAGARAAEQNALKAARAAADAGSAVKASTATAPSAAPSSALADEEVVADGVLSSAGRVSLLAGVAAGREPLFMRTHVNKFRRLPLPYELLQAINEHAECDLDELTLRNLRRRAATATGRAAGAPTRVSKTMKMPPMATTTSSLVDFGPAAVNLGSSGSRRRNAPEELEVRLATRCDEPLRSAAPHNGAVTQEEADALADWGIVRAPTDAAADLAAAEMMRAAGRPGASSARAAGKGSAARRLTLQPTSGDGVLTASARAMCMNRRQTRAAMDAAASGESAENCFFRALLPGASSSAVSDAAQMLRFRYRVEMRNHSKTHALLMLSRRWQFVGCSGMREVVGPGFAGSCPLILPGSSHTYESSAFVPLIVPSPQQLQAHEPASPGRRRTGTASAANSHTVSHNQLLGVPSASAAGATTPNGEAPLSATSASFRQLQDFTANTDGTVFAAAAQHAREFGATVGWMQGAFQFVAVPAEATFSEEGLTLLRKQADRAAGSKNVPGGSAAPGAGPAAFKKFLRRFYDSSAVAGAAPDMPLRVSHVRVVPTALDPFLDEYTVMP